MDRQPGKLSPDTGQDISASDRARKLWSPEEDEKLRLLVSYWGDQRGKNGNWDKISSNFTNRSSKDCRKRWFHSLDPQLKRGKWTEGEDRTLVEAYEQLGPAWQRISQLIPGRTDDQCAKRYTDVLDPKVQDRLREWQPDEDNQLINLVKKHGTKWKLISKEMHCRTGLTCRNRWRKLSRDTDEQSSPGGRFADDKESISERGSVTPMDNMSMNAMPPPASLVPPPPNEVNMLEAGIPGNIPDRRFMPNYPGVAVGTKTYTLSLENPDQYDASMAGAAAVGSGMHHAINELDLDKILAFASEHGQRIVIHQHVYQMSDYETPQAAGHAAASQMGLQSPSHIPTRRTDMPSPQRDFAARLAPPTVPGHSNPSRERFKPAGGMGLGGLGHSNLPNTLPNNPNNLPNLPNMPSLPGQLQNNLPGQLQNHAGQLGQLSSLPGQLGASTDSMQGFSGIQGSPYRYQQFFDPDAEPDRIAALPLSRDGTPSMLGVGLPDELGPMSFDLEQHNLNNAELQLDFLAFNPS